MGRSTLDDDTATRLLRGSLPPDEAPRGFESVAALVRAAHGPATADEVADPRGVVSTLSAQLHDLAVAAATLPRAARSRKRLRRLVASPALVAALVATGAATAAAAAGDLPRPVQSAVAGVASRAGLDIPDPGAHHGHGHHADDGTVAGGTSGDTTGGTTGGTTPSTGPAPSTTALAPPLNGPALASLCHAYASGNGVARGGKADATPFRSLTDAASAAGESVDAYCAAATSTSGSVPTTAPPTTPTTAAATAPSSPGAQHGPPSTLGNGAPHPSNPSSGAHGNPQGTPPGQTGNDTAKGNAGNGSANGRGGNAAVHP